MRNVNSRALRIIDEFPSLLLMGLLIVLIPKNALGSGFPGHLDKYAIEAKYIVVAKCTDLVYEKDHLPSATLEIEQIIKAPKSDSSPTTLRVTGMTSSANRFSFIKGKRFFVFVGANGRADRRGSATMIEGERLSGNLFELICLTPDTDTVKELVEQVQSVLSGDYEERLIKEIKNRDLRPATRRQRAISMVRTFPSASVEPLKFLIEDLCYVRVDDGSCSDICMALARLSPKDTALLWLKLCRKKLPHPYVFYYELTNILGEKGIQIPGLKEHLSDVVAMYNTWHKAHPGETPAAYLLPVFAKNGCRSHEVRDIVMMTLSQDRIDHVTKVFPSIAVLNFPESVPLFWNHIKILKAKNFEYGNNIPHQFVPGVMVHKGGSGDLGAARMALFSKFPILRDNLSDTPPIALGSGWYLLTKKNAQGNRSICFVAWCHDSTSGPRKAWTYKHVPVQLIGQGW